MDLFNKQWLKDELKQQLKDEHEYHTNLLLSSIMRTFFVGLISGYCACVSSYIWCVVFLVLSIFFYSIDSKSIKRVKWEIELLEEIISQLELEDNGEEEEK